MQGVRLGMGLFYWGPASQACIACSATFLSFGPAEQEDLEAGGVDFYLFASLLEGGDGHNSAWFSLCLCLLCTRLFSPELASMWHWIDLSVGELPVTRKEGRGA